MLCIFVQGRNMFVSKSMLLHQVSCTSSILLRLFLMWEGKCEENYLSFSRSQSDTITNVWKTSSLLSFLTFKGHLKCFEVNRWTISKIIKFVRNKKEDFFFDPPWADCDHGSLLRSIIGMNWHSCNNLIKETIQMTRKKNRVISDRSLNHVHHDKAKALWSSDNIINT